MPFVPPHVARAEGLSSGKLLLLTINNPRLLAIAGDGQLSILVSPISTAEASLFLKNLADRATPTWVHVERSTAG
jgi:hypothetical protein